MPDEDDLLCECCEDYCDTRPVPFWKLFLLGWLLFS